MVVGIYIEWHSFPCRLRDRRYAIERLGVGRHFLSSFPIHHPMQATRPGLPPNIPPRSALLIAVSRRGGRDGW
jgi:hypothetical protein